MPVELDNAVALSKALKNYAPDLAKETQKEIAGHLRKVVNQARGFVPAQSPLSGWGNQTGIWEYRAFNAGIMKRGIGYSTTPSKPNKRGFRSLATIFNKSAAGAIYETAGRKSGITGNFTPKLGGRLAGDKQKMTGRAIFRAFEEDQGKATAGVIKAIETSAAKFNARVKK